MNKKIHFQGMESSQAVENYINDALVKIEKFLENEREPIYIDVTVRPGKPHAHYSAELRIKTPHGEIIAEREGAEPYLMIDLVIDSAYHQLHERKKERVEHERTVDKYKGA